MAEDVLEVVDQDLSPVCLQLIGQGTDEGGASRACLGCQVRQEHLEGFLCVQVDTFTFTTHLHWTPYAHSVLCVSFNGVQWMTYGEEAVQVWKTEGVCDLSQNVQGQLSLIG